MKASSGRSLPTRSHRLASTNKASQRTLQKKRTFKNRLLEVREQCKPNSDHAERLVRIALTQAHVVDMNRTEWSLFLDKMGTEIDSPVLSCNPTYDFASLQGIAAVFDESLCGMIKKGSFRADGITAGVSMIFPRWNVGTCTMIIDISKGAFGLAKALFKTTITKGAQVYHIKVGDGPSVRVPLMGFTLGDAEKDAIKKIFQPQVYPVEANGLDSDQVLAATMTIKEEGANVEIVLDPMRGFELAKVLYF